MGKVIQLKKKVRIELVVLKAHLVQTELEAQLNSTKSASEALELALLVLSSLCLIIFKMKMYNDPRVALSNGITKLYTDWVTKPEVSHGK